MHVRQNDIVVVTSGDDRGKRGKVLKAFPAQKRIIVEGVNYIWRHVRRTQKTPAGGRVQKEAPFHVSNVSLYCPRCNRGVRVRNQRGEKGKIIRICVKCKEAI
ncbi:MAG: 50S ribosomal protein L24 [Planctomycetota bacterium]|jgi:large subunit ribosomal protein L24